MATTRKRRPWPKDAPAEASKGGFPQWEHGAFTFEGEIERLGAIGRNMSNAPRWTRVVARIVVLALLVPFLIALVVFVLRLFAG
ncbi:MAG: hypothetical protein M3159_06735 [Actinomycetota bacterium]|nr:hypothetical protein [Actinomycetota bacterium]